MTTAIEAFEQVKKSAEDIKSDAPQRFPEAASPGDYWRQGDVYITLLDAVPPEVILVVAKHQLAPGTTMGSRHCLDSLDGVKRFVLSDADELSGPVLELAKERTITHPEHGDVICPPGVYRITYQRAYADELRRVQD